MTSLVMIKKVKNEELAMTTSNDISEMFDKRHDNVLSSIKNLECSDEFRLLNFKESNYKNSQGKTYLEYLITKDGFVFLAFGFSGKKAAAFKEEYIKQFNKMESLIKERQTQEWQQARLQSKNFNKELTDEIKVFIEYATEQGSKSPKMYYVHFAKLINKALGISSNEIDLTNQITLRNKAILIEVIEKELVENMKNTVFYKEIFKNCKIKVEQLINFIPSLNKKED